MEMDNSNLRYVLETYARKIEYRLEDVFILPLGHDPLLSTYRVGVANNAFCQDSLHIYLRIDQNTVALQHYGEYCGLANASAEIFCETVTGLQVDELATLLESLTVYLKTSNENALVQSERFQIMYELIKMPMSSTRKRCITLPWEAAIDALRN